MPQEEHHARDLGSHLEGVAVRMDDQHTKCGISPEGANNPEECLENLIDMLGVKAMLVGRMPLSQHLHLLHEWHNLSEGVTQDQSIGLSLKRCQSPVS